MKNSHRQLKQAARLIHAGENTQAAQSLSLLLSEDPTNQTAWLWLSSCVETTERKRFCLAKVLTLNPNHPTASRLLHELDAPFESPPAPVSPPSPPAHHSFFKLSFFVLLILSILWLGWNPDRRALRSLRRESAALTQDLQELSLAYQQINLDQQNLTYKFATLTDQYNQLNRTYEDLINTHNQLQVENQKIILAHQILNEEYNQLRVTHDTLLQQHDLLDADYQNLNQIALVPPYISVYERRMNVGFYTRDGALHHWDIPFDLLERDLRRGDNLRSDPPRKKITLNGQAFGQVIDLSKFVDAYPFTGVMPEFYARSASDEDFIREVWYIIGELTNYVGDGTFQDIPRYPLETLLAGGGDCEDLSILLASMILAGRPSWKVELVFMDSHHVNDPETVNHVIVSISTGSQRFLVETTSKTEMLPYPYGVNGWYFKAN